jgi:hypothetical protein
LDVDFGTGQEPSMLFWSKENADPLQTYSIPVTWKGKMFLSAFNQMRRVRGGWKQRPVSESE